MELKLKLTAKDILEKKFAPNFKGYDPREVDLFLDQVLEDYRLLEGLIAKDIKALELKVKELEKSLRQLEDVKAKNALIEEKLKVLNKSKHVALERVDFLVRIDKLERALYKEGVNPNKIV